MSYIPDWNWSLIGKVIVGLCAVIGAGLGIWTFIGQYKDRNRARLAALPKVELYPSTLNEKDWSLIRFRFSSVGEIRFDVTEIRCVNGAEFAESVPPPKDDKPWDPSPPEADRSKTTDRKQVRMQVDIDRGRFAIPNDLFWLRIDGKRRKRRSPFIQFSCHPRSDKAAAFVLRCDL
jgi:hypothetical protein